jgi:hypothetical protein
LLLSRVSDSGVHQASYSVGAGPLSLWLVHVTAHLSQLLGSKMTEAVLSPTSFALWHSQDYCLSIKSQADGHIRCESSPAFQGLTSFPFQGATVGLVELKLKIHGLLCGV